jgi:hypothetical protein
MNDVIVVDKRTHIVLEARLQRLLMSIHLILVDSSHGRVLFVRNHIRRHYDVSQYYIFTQ